MKVTQQLRTKPQAVTVSANTAKLIKSKQQTLILHSLEMQANKMCYLLSEGSCHGIVKVGNPFKLHLSQFHEYFPQHRCTESQRKRWFKNKRIIFAYPVDIIKQMNNKAIVSNTLGELFTEKYEIAEGVIHQSHESRTEFDFSKLSHVSSSSLLVAFNKEKNSFVINLDPKAQLAKEIANHILSCYGPESPIEYGDIFGDIYIPLFESSAVKLKDMKEIKNLCPIPTMDTEGPTLKTLEFRDEKRYVVEKKFEGTSVRLQCWKGIPEIHELNGRSFTDMFPSLSEDMRDLTHGNWIADGVLNFNLSDNSIGIQGMRLFSELSHESSYYLGLFSQCAQFKNDKELEITLLSEDVNILDTLERATGITIQRTLSGDKTLGTISGSVIVKDIIERQIHKSGFCNLLSDRFVRSYIRGLVEGSGGGVVKKEVMFHLKGEELVKYVKRHLSSYLGTTVQSIFVKKDNSHFFRFVNEEAKEVVNFLYTAGPSIEKMKLRAAELVETPLCAHPDEAHAVLWVHDLLYHEQW